MIVRQASLRLRAGGINTPSTTSETLVARVSRLWQSRCRLRAGGRAGLYATANTGFFALRK
jgi:hypothetical protein